MSKDTKLCKLSFTNRPTQTHFRIHIGLVIEFIVQHIAKLNLQQLMFSFFLRCEIEFMSTVFLYAQSRHLCVIYFLLPFQPYFVILIKSFSALQYSSDRSFNQKKKSLFDFFRKRSKTTLFQRNVSPFLLAIVCLLYSVVIFSSFRAVSLL